MSADVIVGIQARCSSTRLPNKVLMDLCGKTMLERVYDACEGPWERAILTSVEPSDDPIAELFEISEKRVFRGSLEDVLSRYSAVARFWLSNPKCLVRVCGDAPFIRREWIEQAVDLCLTEHRPIWMPGALHAGHWTHWVQAAEWCKPEDREHAGHDWFRQEGMWMEEVPEDYFTVNTQEDLDRARALWSEQYLYR